MPEITRHFTVTAFIVYDGKVLLLLHSKLKLWLPPGGHIEENELPEEAAAREVKEETGLDIRLLGKTGNYERVKILLRPANIELQDIQPGHQHINLSYYAVPKETTEVITTELAYKWFSIEELDNKEITESVRQAAKIALKKISRMTA